MTVRRCGAHTTTSGPEPGSDTPVLGQLGETALLASITPGMSSGDDMLLGPGDDTALLRVRSGQVLVTTDTMVLGRDWLDQWSSAADVGGKCVAQNLADIAAMGGRTTGVVVTLVAAPDLPVTWAQEFSAAVASACERAGVAVLGGDLSSAPAGVRTVSITALGEAPGPIVRRSGAHVGDVVAVCGSLGYAAAGLIALQRGDRTGEQVGWQRCPTPSYEQGPAAAAAGATAMIDISDGLLRDAGRIGTASGVRLDLRRDRLTAFADRLTPVVGDDAWDCVLTGGEEHSLLACFPIAQAVPPGWTVIGTVTEPGAGTDPAPVTVDGEVSTRLGWDHFGG